MTLTKQTFDKINIPCSPFRVLLDSRLPKAKYLAPVYHIWNAYMERDLRGDTSFWGLFGGYLTCVSINGKSAPDDGSLLISLSRYYGDISSGSIPGAKYPESIIVMWSSGDMVLLSQDTFEEFVNDYLTEGTDTPKTDLVN